jgi:hypothetical protein
VLTLETHIWQEMPWFCGSCHLTDYHWPSLLLQKLQGPLHQAITSSRQIWTLH